MLNLRTITPNEMQKLIDNKELDVNKKISLGEIKYQDAPYGHYPSKIPLLVAAMIYGRKDLMELLLKNKANVNATFSFWNTTHGEITPLTWAACADWCVELQRDRYHHNVPDEIVKNLTGLRDNIIPNTEILLKYGANPLIVAYNKEKTDFMTLLRYNKTKDAEGYVKLLLKYVPKLEPGDFRAAAENPNPDVVKTLIKEAERHYPKEKLVELLYAKDANEQTMFDCADKKSKTYAFLGREKLRLAGKYKEQIRIYKLKIANKELKQKNKEEKETIRKMVKENPKPRKLGKKIAALYAEKQND